jgi:hypothetical protein
LSRIGNKYAVYLEAKSDIKENIREVAKYLSESPPKRQILNKDEEIDWEEENNGDRNKMDI